jgi:type II secretory pathway pseudopilin PulG
MMIQTSTHRSRRRQAGYSLAEVVISMGIMTAIMGATMTALTQARRATESAVMVSGLNNSLRTGMDLMVRDMLQVGSGLPPGHVILTASGTNSTKLNIPGPPGTAFQTVAGDTDWSALVPGPGLGPTINGVPTDVITVLTADNNFNDIPLTAVTNTTMDVAATNAATGLAIVINTGPDRILTGQLMMIEKGSNTTLVQVTAVDYPTRRVTFAAGDSLKLNQPIAASGNITALRAAAPPDVLPALPAVQVIPTTASRIRMISYYLDTVVPNHPRLVRRINNGHPTTFDNALGTAVAIDVENLQFTFDLADGNTNPAAVRFTAADLGVSGACAPNPCSVNQIRKINILLTGRSSNNNQRQNRMYRNTLTSQVSLRGMAFVDEYLSPP